MRFDKNSIYRIPAAIFTALLLSIFFTPKTWEQIWMWFLSLFK